LLTSTRFCNSPFFIKPAELFGGFVPDSFADESGQAAAISGFAFESIAGTAAILEGNGLQNFGFDVGFGFNVIKFVLHFPVLLTFIFGCTRSFSLSVNNYTQ